ncbi:MAG: hypothetical protein ACTSRA_09175 [Promethearchaeota archaeon]
MFWNRNWESPLIYRDNVVKKKKIIAGMNKSSLISPAWKPWR